MKHYTKLFYFFSLAFSLLFNQVATAQSHDEDESFAVESYYKIKWGYADEFISLWKKNHLPLDREAQKKGDILSIVAEKPRLHSGEETRWDFKVTVIYKNSHAAFDHDLTAPYRKKIYTDLEKLSTDEKHRFELVISHWDVMTEKVSLE